MKIHRIEYSVEVKATSSTSFTTAVFWACSATSLILVNSCVIFGSIFCQYFSMRMWHTCINILFCHSVTHTHEDTHTVRLSPGTFCAYPRAQQCRRAWVWPTCVYECVCVCVCVCVWQTERERERESIIHTHTHAHTYLDGLHPALHFDRHHGAGNVCNVHLGVRFDSSVIQITQYTHAYTYKGTHTPCKDTHNGEILKIVSFRSEWHA